MDKRVTKVDSEFCKYQPKEPSFEEFFAQYPNDKLDIDEFEYHVPSEWSVIVDEYGELENLCEQLGIDSNLSMAKTIGRYIKCLKNENSRYRKALHAACEYTHYNGLNGCPDKYDTNSFPFLHEDCLRCVEQYFGDENIEYKKKSCDCWEKAFKELSKNE